MSTHAGTVGGGLASVMEDLERTYQVVRPESLPDGPFDSRACGDDDECRECMDDPDGAFGDGPYEFFCHACIEQHFLKAASAPFVKLRANVLAVWDTVPTRWFSPVDTNAPSRLVEAFVLVHAYCRWRSEGALPPYEPPDDECELADVQAFLLLNEGVEAAMDNIMRMSDGGVPWRKIQVSKDGTVHRRFNKYKNELFEPTAVRRDAWGETDMGEHDVEMRRCIFDKKCLAPFETYVTSFLDGTLLDTHMDQYDEHLGKVMDTLKLGPPGPGCMRLLNTCNVLLAAELVGPKHFKKALGLTFSIIGDPNIGQKMYPMAAPVIPQGVAPKDRRKRDFAEALLNADDTLRQTRLKLVEKAPANVIDDLLEDALQEIRSVQRAMHHRYVDFEKACKEVYKNVYEQVTQWDRALATTYGGVPHFTEGSTTAMLPLPVVKAVLRAYNSADDKFRLSVGDETYETNLLVSLHPFGSEVAGNLVWECFVPHEKRVLYQPDGYTLRVLVERTAGTVSTTIEQKNNATDYRRVLELSGMPTTPPTFENLIKQFHLPEDLLNGATVPDQVGADSLYHFKPEKVAAWSKRLEGAPMGSIRRDDATERAMADLATEAGLSSSAPFFYKDARLRVSSESLMGWLRTMQEHGWYGFRVLYHGTKSYEVWENGKGVSPAFAKTCWHGFGTYFATDPSALRLYQAQGCSMRDSSGEKKKLKLPNAPGSGMVYLLATPYQSSDKAQCTGKVETVDVDGGSVDMVRPWEDLSDDLHPVKYFQVNANMNPKRRSQGFPELRNCLVNRHSAVVLPLGPVFSSGDYSAAAFPNPTGFDLKDDL